MKTSKSRLLSSAAFLSYSTLVSADCSPQPILFPVTNISVSQGLISRGIQFRIGTPPQNFSFLPNVELNNTYAYDSSLACDGKTSKYCATFHGGWYDAQSSSSRGDSSSNGLSTDVKDFGGYLFNASAASWVAENLTLSSNSSINGLPIGIPKAPIGNANYQPLGVVGVSTGSSLLNSLTNGNLTAARVWSYFNGLTGSTPSTQGDGQFVVGGYDSQRVQGTGYNFSLGQQPTDCTYPVTIDDMTLDYPNGTSASIFPGSRSSALSACLDPTFPVLMSMPLTDYFANFLKITGMRCDGRSFGVNYYGVTCDAQNLFQGDFSIKIKSGPKITVPNSQLIVPDVKLADDGSLTANQSARELLINSIQDINANDTLQLGRQFFAAAYMMANLDRGQFTLWQARPNVGVAPQLVAVDKNGAGTSFFCTGATTAANANTTLPDVSPNSAYTSAANASASTGISGGAIAGIVIGVLAGCALVAAAVFLFLRQRRMASRTAQSGTSGAALMAGAYSDKSGYAGKDATAWAPHPPESVPPVAEMGGSGVPATGTRVISVAEMPTQMRMHEMPGQSAALLQTEPQELP